ncbi:MAG: lipoyl synthase [Candidatus Omnitrophica bacterium]|nr:lipoyl synthase [Candidatus Omnitrophota bacterium]
MPSWLGKNLPLHESIKELSSYLRSNHIETVCLNSRCPNAGECYSEGNVSFLILGNTCTRDCLFCAIRGGVPGKIDPDEPARIAGAVRRLKLKYVVVTSVTRDDLPDGGASHYSDVIKAIKHASPDTVTEALVPDFKGSKRSIDTILDSGADVFSHNMEVVSRLYHKIRPDFGYSLSLDSLRYAFSRGTSAIKSGFMVGLGELDSEIDDLLGDLKNTGCTYLTIGQYLKPKGSRLDVEEYIRPEKFIALKEKAMDLGFKKVASGPFVRSSYRAGELYFGQGV